MTFPNLINTYLGAPFWKGIASIATLSVVILTYFSLKRFKKERRDQINREAIEKIYAPLLQDLKNILSFSKIETLEVISSSGWRWEKIKEKRTLSCLSNPGRTIRNVQ